MGTLQSCISASEAVQQALTGSFGSTAISVRERFGVALLELGTMTPFGPVVRSWPAASYPFVQQVIADTAKATDGRVFLYAPTHDGGADRMPIFEDEGDVFAAFDHARPVVPSRRDGDSDYALWWSIAASPAGESFLVGDVLELCEEIEDGRVTLRYRGADGRDAGLHTILERELLEEERQIVRQSRAIVHSLAFGVGLDDDGDSFRTQTLMLRIPLDLARSFEDGRMPLLRPQHAEMENEIV